MNDAPEYLRAGYIAALTGVSLRTVRRWITDETIPSIKLGGTRLVGEALRHYVIERTFCRLKDSRRIATRYDKLARNFLAGLYLVIAICYWI